jgi:FkbM family methyltransferase
MAFALHLLRPGDLFVDVGANVGSYTILATAAGAESIAFEPGERFADLQRNVALNGARADCRKVAVGAAPGAIRFTTDLDCANHVADSEEHTVEVEVVALDDVLTRTPTLIKVDTEGYEGCVIEGGMKSFATATAVIIELQEDLKYGHDGQEVRRTLADLGYRRVDYDPINRSLVPPTQRCNSTYVRGDISARLKDAKQYRVRNQWI